MICPQPAGLHVSQTRLPVHGRWEGPDSNDPEGNPMSDTYKLFEMTSEPLSEE